MFVLSDMTAVRSGYVCPASGPQILNEAQREDNVPLKDLVQCRETRQRGIEHHQTRERSSAITATKIRPMTKNVPTKSPKAMAMLVATKSASRRS